MLGLLQIYDADDEATRDTAGDRGGVSHSVAVTGGREGFANAVNRLAVSGRIFDRVVVESHGGPGQIYFGGQFIDAAFLRVLFTGNYLRLFPMYTRMYFNGCYVAQDGTGWDFLESAGAIFLKAGGSVFAHTSAGYAFPGWVPMAGSHTVHFSGSTRFVEVGFGGVILGRDTSEAQARRTVVELQRAGLMQYRPRR